MRKNIAVRVAALLLLNTLPNGFTFSQEDPSDDLVLSVLGTWTTGRITVDGTKVTHTLELKKSSERYQSAQMPSLGPLLTGQ